MLISYEVDFAISEPKISCYKDILQAYFFKNQTMKQTMFAIGIKMTCCAAEHT